MMSKGELRAARKAARAAGAALTGELACKGAPIPEPQAKPVRTQRSRERVASREEQYGRYLDCGPAAWDDRGLSPDF